MSEDSTQDPRRLPVAGGVLGMPSAEYARSGTGELASLARATAWLNTPPLTPADLRGHVVAVDFWTYTCVNWLRTLPYLRAWAARYQDAGLVVIGVHAPEFPFEHDLENVRQAARDLRIGYPIAQDNDFAIWRGFHNHYWPALYLFDGDGNVRHHHFGEGDYARSEIMIQRLLAEAGVGGIAIGEDLATDSVEPQGAEVAADWNTLKSPETYCGYALAEGFASPGGLAEDSGRVYTAPTMLRLNQWSLVGDWTIRPKAAVLNTAGGRIVYRFHARDLNLAMGPLARGGTPVPFRVRLDGAPPGTAHGGDVDEQGNGTLTDQRLYQLIRHPTPIADRQFEIELLDANAQACVFTFG
jgi:thiol-disulfide isomerase/thioredoxin